MSRLRFSHPNRAQLAEWLDGESTDEEVITLHIDQCDRCASRLDALAADDESPDVDDELANAIRNVYEPPADLNDRVMKHVDARERANREMNLFLGLFAIGKDAAELMMPSDGEER